MSKLLDEVQQHQEDSKSYMQTLRGNWPDLESMLIVRNREQIQNDNKVYDPRLATIEVERTARVMARHPQGKPKARSKDDIGKNMLMAMLLDYQMDTAKEQFSFITKLRMLSLMSRVYGSMFALVPWRVTNNRVGPELNIISIWDSFPQPNIQVSEADWFTQGHMLSVQWLLKQVELEKNKENKVWKADAIMALASELKRDQDEGDKVENDDENSYIQEELTPSQFGDVVFPKVKAYTEYRRDRWITWTPQRQNSKTSRPHILREVKSPYPERMLPIVAKHSIPNLDTPVGTGPFERGKSIQFALNSLVNLYLEGVKTETFPELMMNPNAVVPSTIKFGAAEKWFMNNPGQDVVPFSRGGNALQTFNSTYGLLVSMLLSHGGTTDTSSSAFTEQSQGRTPQALRLQAAAQATQDEWEQAMLEETIHEVMYRWIALNAHKLDGGQSLRVFGPEMDDIKGMYPDMVETFQGNAEGRITVDRNFFGERDEDSKQVRPVKWDYEIETGSTTKPNPDQDKETVSDILQFLSQNPDIIQEAQSRNIDINRIELLKRDIQNKGVKDVDRIVIDNAEKSPGEEVEQPGQPVMMEQDADMDEDIASVGAELLGGMQGIPPVQPEQQQEV